MARVIVVLPGEGPRGFIAVKNRWRLLVAGDNGEVKDKRGQRLEAY